MAWAALHEKDAPALAVSLAGAPDPAQAVNAPGPQETTLLIEAASKGLSADIVEALLEAGADGAARDGLGQTAAHFAANFGHVQALCALAKADARYVNLRAPTGLSPIECALARSQVEAFRILVDAGVDLSPSRGKPEFAQSLREKLNFAALGDPVERWSEMLAILEAAALRDQARLAPSSPKPSL